MQAHLHRVEVEPAFTLDNDLAIEGGRRTQVHELRRTVVSADDLEDLRSQRVQPSERTKEPERRGRRRLSGPGPTREARRDLPLRGPPKMRPKWKVDVYDRVRTLHSPVDDRPWAESIDDPRVLGRPCL